MSADRAYKYNLPISEIISFFSNRKSLGFSVKEIETMQEKYSCFLPAVYQKYLFAYGADEINQKHHVLFAPKEIFTSYDGIEMALADLAEEFDGAIQNKQEQLRIIVS